MATPSLFPVFLKAAAAGVVVLEGLEVALMADPEIVLDEDVGIVVDAEGVSIVLDSEPVIEVD